MSYSNHESYLRWKAKLMADPERLKTYRIKHREAKARWKAKLKADLKRYEAKKVKDAEYQKVRYLKKKAEQKVEDERLECALKTCNKEYVCAI